ncbi:MAG: hypothetical protein KAR39_02935 [Thermoplasmata archaeon]|nr:hypothetical protein [Thermoplasmata archaeon]
MDISLVKLGFVNSRAQAVKYFEGVVQAFESKDVEDPDFFHRLLDLCSERARDDGKSDGSLRNLRGNWFEFAIGLLLVRRGLIPFYYQASLVNIPNVIYDFIVYTKEVGPISLSAKTSLRERYKQTDLEAMVLKNVYRRGECHLLTLDDKTAVNTLKGKIERKDVLGLDGVHRGGEIHELFDGLGEYALMSSGVIRSGRLVGIR